MQTFRIDNDEKHLYLKNMESKNDKEELAEVMQTLHDNECIIIDRIVSPDCTLYQCKMNGYRFAVCDASMDGDGVFLCVDDLSTMEYLEEVFIDEKMG